MLFPNLIALAKWNLAGPKTRVMREEKLTQAEADEMEFEYKRFMALCITHPGKRFAIIPAVDALWHAHVLYTRDYAAFGEAICGHFIHHDPVEGHNSRDESSQMYFTNTLPLYRKFFGEPTSVWPKDAEAFHCSQCGDAMPDAVPFHDADIHNGMRQAGLVAA